MFDWIWNNRQWVFSGVGVALVTAIAYTLRRYLSPTDGPRQQSQASGAHSVNVQAGRDVTIGKQDR
jgi:hypothetical protein